MLFIEMTVSRHTAQAFPEAALAEPPDSSLHLNQRVALTCSNNIRQDDEQ